MAAIVAEAWALARIQGIAGLSLHALAREVGIKQPSLYAYFDSKHALYDAMFADGNRQLIERLDAAEASGDPRAAAHTFMRAFVAFGLRTTRVLAAVPTADPEFEPSAGSYAYAEKVLTRVGRPRCTRRGSSAPATSTASSRWWPA